MSCAVRILRRRQVTIDPSGTLDAFTDCQGIPSGGTTQRQAIKLIVLGILCCHCAIAARLGDGLLPSETLTARIPLRPPNALSGSAFIGYVSNMDPQHREQAIRDELLRGNLPDFLRRLVPVELQYRSPGKKVMSATIFVMPDYLAIGSDDDCLRIPMNLYSALSIATRFGFVLPTKKMVDAIYAQSAYHLVPEPLPAGPRMRSTDYYRFHNQLIERQVHDLGIRLGDLVSGHKKDVVITNRLAQHDGRIAIYGWQRPNGIPIQPLSTVHGAGYADYSHGIRLISELAIVGGQVRSIYDLLGDPGQANIVSGEGPIGNLLWSHLPRDPLLPSTIE